MQISDFKALIIDMDGVLWRGKTFLPGLHGFFQILRQRSVPFILATNNSTATPQGIVDRLAEADIELHPGEVLTSSMATAAYLLEHFAPATKVLAVGEAAVRDALSQAGFELRDDPDDVDVVVVGFDREISWQKLTRAALAVQAGAVFVGTNPDLSFPIEQGQAPGNGAFVTVVQLTTGVEPVIIGKPEPRLYQQAAQSLGFPPEAILTVGDRLETDILGGQRAGMSTALLLSGVTSPEQAASAQIKADWIFDDLAALTRQLAAV